ncbi:hypothetical protein D5018_17570 [Parashewanella curva]|uniref:Uncharacterized protein n=1 Tax=Parashewanella curva TaxID=2338552 RepID=A0A3L8PSR0_9GAMM|nr:hypothetical protein [Parashewanella curva]RLV58396.1 hypothetical protein D5018_17570 [Parashewanella curva]
MASTNIPNRQAPSGSLDSQGMLVLRLEHKLVKFKYGSLVLDFSKDDLNQFKVEGEADTYLFNHDSVRFRVNISTGEIRITAEKARLSKFFTQALYKKAYKTDLGTNETTALRDFSYYSTRSQAGKQHQILKPLTQFINRTPTTVDALTHPMPTDKKYNDEQSIKEDLREGVSLNQVRARLQELKNLLGQSPNSPQHLQFNPEDYSWLFKDPQHSKIYRYQEHIRRLIKKLEKQDAIEYASLQGWNIKPLTNPALNNPPAQPAQPTRQTLNEEIGLETIPHQNTQTAPSITEIDDEETDFNTEASTNPQPLASDRTPRAQTSGNRTETVEVHPDNNET